MKKLLIGGAAVALIAGLVADDVYLHVKLQDTADRVVKVRSGNELALKAVADLKADFAGFADELKSFEKLAAEKDGELVKAVNRLEDWVETSSVQGKWNGYKRQLGDYEARMEEKCRQAKDSLQRKIDTMKLKCQKIRDVLAE